MTAKDKLTAILLILVAGSAHLPAAEPLAGTEPLDTQADLAAEMVAGIGRYLDRALVDSVGQRQQNWNPNADTPEAYEKWLAPKRDRLRTLIGAVDPRRPVPAVEFISTTDSPSVVGIGAGYMIHAVRWPVLDGVDAEGLLLEPQGEPVAQIVALPDADTTPEQLVGLQPGIRPAGQFARRLAENGCRVLVPMLIDRADTLSGNPDIRFTNQPHREFVYRPAYEMGRHVIGYEVQKVLAAVDWFSGQPTRSTTQIGVIGYGEGGLLALHAAAQDTRINAAVISGYVRPRESVWREPIYRNVWALLTEFGDAELLNMILPRTAIVEAAPHPAVEGPPEPRSGRSGAAPGTIDTPLADAVRREFQRAQALAAKPDFAKKLHLIETEIPGDDATLTTFLHALGADADLKPAAEPALPSLMADSVQPRLKRQFDQLNAFTQKLARRSAVVRDKLWSSADGSSIEKWVESTRPLRDRFRDEIIGALPPATGSPNPRTRLVNNEKNEPEFRAYEVLLNVLPDVNASGILLLPKNLKPDERRPVVVCQHGLEGAARDTITTEGQAFNYYQSFSVQLVKRGFIVYAPQNPYIGRDEFRVLQRKANPLKLSLFSFIVRQHEVTVDWLAGLPFVDSTRIGFYGLSYGGKTAMRVPAILDDRYALSICSADFNEWIWKNTSITDKYSYVFTGEYEMFEFNLGHTFNYAEMAALIAPRPFMVERGHHDGVAPDEQVAYEYAKVRRRYAELGIPDRTTIEFFLGPHQIHGVATFDFLHQHLNWPKP
jgi:dienelactone hydrolase